jgi:glutamyl-tRNA synthetase
MLLIGLLSDEHPLSMRVRIAPSPTGSVHLGLCRTALFNWAYARHAGGTFVLRIEDTDIERNTPESLAAILEGLRWLGLDWDEGPEVGGEHGPYFQTQRLAHYSKEVEVLLAAGHLYRDFSTPEQQEVWRAEQEQRKQRVAYRGTDRELGPEASLERAQAGEPFAMRFRIPEGETRFTDLVRGDVTLPHGELDDWVLVRRGGGMPTYNFTVVSDDMAMGITCVLRGEEHLVNTPKQLLLYEALGSEPPAFGHLPLLLGKDRRKLSKRTGDTSLGDYRAKGYPRDAILNFLALQGWALDGETEVFSMETFVEHFDPAQVSKGGAIFDPDKFLWLAGEYLRAESPADLAEHCLPFVLAEGLARQDELRGRWDWFVQLIQAVQERLSLYSDAPRWLAPYLVSAEDLVYETKAEKGARKHEGAGDLLMAFAAWLAERPASEDPALAGAAARQWLEDRGAKIGSLFQPLRCALTGQPGGPDLFLIISLLGRQEALLRIERMVGALA